MLWIANIEGGPRIHKGAAVAVDGKIFQFGNVTFGDKIHMEVFVLHPSSSNRWQRVMMRPEDSEDWPTQRSQHTVVAKDEHVFLFGGWSSDLYVFNTASYKWTKPIVNGEAPLQRQYHTSCVVGNGMYVYGGLQAGQLASGVHRLDLSTMTWSLLDCRGDAPCDRQRHSATAIGDRMYIYGGLLSTSLDFDAIGHRLHYLDTTTNTWRSPVTRGGGDGEQALGPGGRFFHSSLEVDGKLLILGGLGKRPEYLNDLWLLDPVTWTWSLARPRNRSGGPGPTAQHAMCKVGERIFVIGRGCPSAKGINKTTLFVLDLNPSLKTLCLRHVIDNGEEEEEKTKELPRELQREIQFMTEPNPHFGRHLE